MKERKELIIDSAKWCFLNFGYSKTSFEDIAKKANISRTLIYRVFKNKDEIYAAVFANLLISKHDKAKEIANSSKSIKEKLIEVCKLTVVEPYIELLGTVMGNEFFDACQKVDPKINELHRTVVFECLFQILKKEDFADVFIHCLDGFITDEPTVEKLIQRIEILSNKFTK